MSDDADLAALAHPGADGPARRVLAKVQPQIRRLIEAMLGTEGMLRDVARALMDDGMDLGGWDADPWLHGFRVGRAYQARIDARTMTHVANAMRLASEEADHG